MAHVHQNIFEKLYIYDFTLLLAHFVSKLAQCVFNHLPEFEIGDIFPRNGDCRLSKILQRLTVPRIIDQFRRKKYQKNVNMFATNFYMIIVQKYFVEHQLWAVKDSFITYV